jgi:hypothetical protein
MSRQDFPESSEVFKNMEIQLTNCFPNTNLIHCFVRFHEQSIQKELRIAIIKNLFLNLRIVLHKNYSCYATGAQN